MNQNNMFMCVARSLIWLIWLGNVAKKWQFSSEGLKGNRLGQRFYLLPQHTFLYGAIHSHQVAQGPHFTL